MVLQWGVTAWQRIILTLTASETHRFVAKPLRLDDWRTEQLLVRYYVELRAEPH